MLNTQNYAKNLRQNWTKSDMIKIYETSINEGFKSIKLWFGNQSIKILS